MEHKDYYKVMGLTKDATEKEIKLAYRKLARKYHPDVSQETDAEERFKEVGEAYEVLKDPEKRKKYDEYLANQDFTQSQGAYSQHKGTGGASYANDAAAFDFFESLFGASARGFHAQRPTSADLHASIAISLDEAVHGTVKDIQLSGHHGTEHLRVKIPPGIRNGQQIRLSGKGEPAGAYAEPGSLFITIHVKKHPYFDVMGDDIYVTLPVSPWEVALGSKVVVPTLTGKVDLKIPPGSQGGQKLRLKGKGLPGKVVGDLFILLKIVTPVPMTEEAKALYQKMAEIMPMNPREKMGAGS